jgi:hypothetical protein
LSASNDGENQKSNSYAFEYKSLLDCRNEYSKLSPGQIKSQSENTASQDLDKYKEPADEKTHSIRITRGVVVYFPIESANNFQTEFRWLYRSWIEMQKHEPGKWRTDLLVFIDKQKFDSSKDIGFLRDLNCSFVNTRIRSIDLPMCTLIDYVAIKDRKDAYLSTRNPRINSDDVYQFFMNELDIFDPKPDEKELFLNLLSSNLATYGYLDSILVAYEGYAYFKSAGFDFLIRLKLLNYELKKVDFVKYNYFYVTIGPIWMFF